MLAVRIEQRASAHVGARGTEQHAAGNRRHAGTQGAQNLVIRLRTIVAWPERKLVQQARNERVTTCRAERGSVNLDDNAVAQADALARLGFDELREHGHRSQ